MKDVIVSFSSRGRDDYNKLLLRLIDSCEKHWGGDMLVYSPDHFVNSHKGVTIHKGWPQPKGVKSYTHSEMPYQFKTALIQEAIEKGYERIIWLDSSMQLCKDLTPLFDYPITTFHNLGHPTYKYLSQKAEDLLRAQGFFSGADLTEIPQIWGGAFSLNFQFPQTGIFFDSLKNFSINGSFSEAGSTRNGFIAHRHDQSVMSVLVYGKSIRLPYGNILCPPHDKTGEYGTDPYLICRGL